MTKNETMCYFDDLRLLGIVTLSEACFMWGKTRKTVYLRLLKGDLVGRRAFTGGDYLLLVDSLIDLWGDPQFDTIGEYFVEKSYE